MTGSHDVETLVVLQPIEVDTGSADREGQLVMANGMLVAILVRLQDPDHERVGHWFLEVAFGRLQNRHAPVFANLTEATRWLRRSLKR